MTAATAITPNIEGKSLYVGPTKDRIPATPENIGSYMVWRPLVTGVRNIGLYATFVEAVEAANEAAVEGRTPSERWVEVHAIAAGWGYPECRLYCIKQ